VRTLPLSTIGRALRSKVWLILLLTLGAGLVAFEASLLRPPVYEASTLLSIDESQNPTQGFDVAMQADQFLAQRFISMGTSREVLQAVCAKEGNGCTPTALARQVRVTTPQATAQLVILADASSPETAARLANRVADALIARNRAQVDQRMGAQIKYLQGQLQALGAQLGVIVRQVSANEAGNRPDTAGTAQLTFLQTEYSSTYQHLQDLEVQRTQQADVLSVEQRAVAPRLPADPDPVRYVLVGLAGGLAVAVLVALLAEGMRTRIKRSSELSDAAGVDFIADFGQDLVPGAGRPYGFLAQISLEEPNQHPPGLLLVGSTLGERVNVVGRELANAVAASGRRVLVLLAPTSTGGGGWWRRKMDYRPASSVLVEPDGSEGHPALRSGDDVDLVIHCSLPPMLDPSGTWLRAMPDRAILVATRGVTRFGEVRRTVDALGRAGVQVVAAIMLPVRIDPPPLAAVANQALPEPSRSATAAFEQ
jgi:capsular polysaccharide biosynthesis protein